MPEVISVQPKTVKLARTFPAWSAALASALKPSAPRLR